MLYAVVLYVHSWLRWIVIAAGLAVFARALRGASLRRPWRDPDRRLGVAFISALDTQVLLGLLLYFVLSPITPRSLADLRAFMHAAPLRFFAVEHGTGMVAAVIAAHAGRSLANRAREDAGRHRRTLIGVCVSLVAIAVSVPWPWLSYGRPLVRP
jgi:hypothetical protein